MLTIEELNWVLNTRPTGVNRGRMLQLRTRVDPKKVSAPAQRRLLDHLLDTKPDSDTPPRHPDNDVRLQPRVGESSGRKPRPLDQSDRDWLNRLPESDRISYDDAVRLAEISRDVAPRSSDERLVNSIWEPVQSRFDRAVARHNLTEARKPLPRIPAGYADTALAEAVAATTTELDADEIRHRGARLAREINAAREQNRETAISKALKAQAALEQADRDRALTA